MYSAGFNDKNPSDKIEFPVDKGGMLEFIVTGYKGMDGKENNIVWGEPVLLKY